MSRVLVIGSLNIDEVFSVPHLLRPGETISSLSYQKFVGGKGNNQALALARAGAKVSFAGKIGTDGEFAIKMLAQNGVDISLVKISQTVATGRAIIQVDSNGQNCILLYGGANRDITLKDIDDFLQKGDTGDILLLQNEISYLPYIINSAKVKGFKIFLNPSPIDEEIQQAPLQLVDCFIMNEIEGAAFTEIILSSNDNFSLSVYLQQTKNKLRRKFPNADFVITLGAQGSYWVGKDGTDFYTPALPVTPVDTTAAGDTFTGYFIATFLEKGNPQEAMEKATAAAALCVQRNGAAQSIPWNYEIKTKK